MSSNFERLLWYLAYDTQGLSTANAQEKRQSACSRVKEWQTELRSKGGFRVEKSVLDAAKADFSSERVSDAETLSTIRDIYREKGYVLDPHSAIGVTAAMRSVAAAPGVYTVALATAHPAKFSVSTFHALNYFFDHLSRGASLCLRSLYFYRNACADLEFDLECRGDGAQGREGVRLQRYIARAIRWYGSTAEKNQVCEEK